MTGQQVSTVLRWMWRNDPEFVGLTVFNLFSTAYYHTHDGKLDVNKIAGGMLLLRDFNQAPFWVDSFIHQRIYPNFVVHEEPKLLTHKEVES